MQGGQYIFGWDRKIVGLRQLCLCTHHNQISNGKKSHPFKIYEIGEINVPAESECWHDGWQIPYGTLFCRWWGYSKEWFRSLLSWSTLSIKCCTQFRIRKVVDSKSVKSTILTATTVLGDISYKLTENSWPK